MPMLTQLTRLSRLKLSLSGFVAPESVRSCDMCLPSLRSLHVREMTFADLTLKCPALRSLCLHSCYIEGNLTLQSPLEELSCTDCLNMLRVFPLSNLHSLTRLHCDHLTVYPMKADIFNVLPLMTDLRSLDIISYTGCFPRSLPASLGEIRFVLHADCQWRYDNSNALKQLQYFGYACQLPELQRIDLWRCGKWEPCELQKIRRMMAKSNVKTVVTVRDGIKDEEIFPEDEDEEPFPYAASRPAKWHRMPSQWGH